MAVYVRTTRFFYGYRLIGLAIARDGQAMAFRSVEQAKSYIKSQGKKQYLLEVDEHCRPQYEILAYESLPEQLKHLIRVPAGIKIKEKENADA